jgi:hypothetical protein
VHYESGLYEFSQKLLVFVRKKSRQVNKGKPENKRPLGRLGSPWENNIKMDIRKLGREVVD